MSKYDKLWDYIKEQNKQEMILTYEQIKDIAGIPLDHSFLKYKKELLEFGFCVGKISMKNETVNFIKSKE